jgi:hypothetical protein
MVLRGLLAVTTSGTTSSAAATTGRRVGYVRRAQKIHPNHDFITYCPGVFTNMPSRAAVEGTTRPAITTRAPHKGQCHEIQP